MTPGSDPDIDNAPAIRFKRRKLQHPKRAAAGAQDDIAVETVISPIPNPASADEQNDATASIGYEDAAPNLKEILRMRKRPGDRVKDAARRAAERRTEIVLRESGTDAVDGAIVPEDGRRDQYAGRFIAQTGQVVDVDEGRMAKFVEARLAEQNHRLHGWPIPHHLEEFVAKLTPTSTPVPRTAASSASPLPSAIRDQEESPQAVRPDRDVRLAAGMGKLQEVDLGPEAATKSWARHEDVQNTRSSTIAQHSGLINGQSKEQKPGKRRRWQKRRNSEDIARDAAVEAVLRESRLNIFEKETPPSPPANYNSDAEDAGDAMLEQFRRDYMESQESQKRKPAPPPGLKGVKEQPKGPKLGGSRSARAAMQKLQEEAGKGVKR